jgi:hypothetical protein
MTMTANSPPSEMKVPIIDVSFSLLAFLMLFSFGIQISPFSFLTFMINGNDFQ